MSSSTRVACLVVTGTVTLVVLGMPMTRAADQRSSPANFAVATWNIRSGMGVHRSSAPWDHGTLNCTDTSKPMNAWGIGLPQRELKALAANPAIVAVAVQESWNCGKPRQVNQVLGFKAITREQQGVALAARYGFAGEPVYYRIDQISDRWVIGGAVCLDAQCTRSIDMFSTHWAGKTDADFPTQARAALEFLKTRPEPQLFMGDLNVFQIDRWNPKVPCTAEDDPGRTEALASIARAGYVDAWKATQTGEGLTGMSSRPGCGTPPGSLYKRIDYIFVRGLQVVRTERFGRVAPGADAPSDHAGLIAELQVPPR